MQELIQAPDEQGYSVTVSDDGFGIILKVWDGNNSGEFTLNCSLASSLWGSLRHAIDSTNMRDKDRTRYFWDNWIVPRVGIDAIHSLVDEFGKEVTLSMLFAKSLGEHPKPFEIEVLVRLYDASKEGDGAR